MEKGKIKIVSTLKNKARTIARKGKSNPYFTPKDKYHYKNTYGDYVLRTLAKHEYKSISDIAIALIGNYRVHLTPAMAEQIAKIIVIRCLDDDHAPLIYEAALAFNVVVSAVKDFVYYKVKTILADDRDTISATVIDRLDDAEIYLQKDNDIWRETICLNLPADDFYTKILAISINIANHLKKNRVHYTSKAFVIKENN